MNNLFDISTLFTHGSYKGLFFDNQLQIWTNQNGRFRRLANQWSLPSGDYPYSLVNLREYVAKSTPFREFLKRVKDSLNEVNEKNTLKGKFVIAIVDDGLPVFPRSPQVFNTREEAIAKLVRYQQLNPDTNFCLFECKGELKHIDVVLE